MIAGPLDGVRVLAVGADVATRYASWWLSECGADVAVHRPGWQADATDETEALFERVVGRGVRAAEFDGDTAYSAIVGDADSLSALTDGIPRALRAQASIVEVTSPFPGGASFAAVQSHDVALWARSGLGYLTRETTDDLELGDPCLPLNRQASFLAGMAAAFAVAADALAGETGAPRSRRISYDKLELLALMPMQPIAFAQMEDRIVGKNPEVPYPGGVMATADGVAFVRPVNPPHWASLFRVAGELEWAAEGVEATPDLLLEGRDLIDARLREWAGSVTREGLVADAQVAHVPVAPICHPSEMRGDAHLAAREFFGTSAAAPPVRLPWLSRVDPAGAEAPPKTATGAVRPSSASPALPLAGLRVLDLTWAWAGPFATTMLADLGAEVVNIEMAPNKSTLRKNPPFLAGREESDNVAGWWSANQRGKFSLGVNMKAAAGAQIIRELAAESDMVVENFSPGVVDRLGVGYEDLLAVNPRLVYVSMSAYGQTGPQAHYINYGTQLYAASGASFATSRDASSFSQMWIPYPDPVSGLAGAFVLAAYAYGARASGRPAYVDLSEFESLCCIVLEPLLAAAEAAGDAPSNAGLSGQADYRVVWSADERFVALIVPEPASWPVLGAALGARDASAEALRQAASRLDVAGIVARAEPAGAIVAPVQDSAECLDDADLNGRGFWVDDMSPEIAGNGVRIGGSIWHVDGERTAICRGAPPLYSDSRMVLEGLLGYPASRVDELIAGGAVWVPSD